MFSRQMRTAKAGMTPNPRERRQTARRWSLPNLCKMESAEVSKTRSPLPKKWDCRRAHPKKNEGNKRGDNESKIDHRIWQSGMRTSASSTRGFFVLVASANQRCCAFFAIPSSSDCSEAATDPQGYSAPTPMPRRKLMA